MQITFFFHFDTNPRFPPFLLYVRWKSGVTFLRRCFRDGVRGGLNNIGVLALKAIQLFHGAMILRKHVYVICSNSLGHIDILLIFGQNIDC